MDRFHLVVINLKSRSDRRDSLEKIFAGWNLHFIEAIDKDELPQHFQQTQVRSTGAWACFLSHQKAFMHSLQFPMSIVMEDDCRFLTPEALLRVLEWCEANDNKTTWDMMIPDYLFVREDAYPAGVSRLIDPEQKIFEIHNAWGSTMIIYNSRIRDYLAAIPWAYYGNPIDGVFKGTFKTVSASPKVIYQNDQGNIAKSYSTFNPELDTRILTEISKLKEVEIEDSQECLRLLALQGFDLVESKVDILAFCGDFKTSPWFMGLYRLLGILEPAVRLTLCAMCIFCSLPRKRYLKMLLYKDERLVLDNRLVNKTPELMKLCNKYA